MTSDPSPGASLRAGLFVLFLAPLAFLGSTLAVAIHEVLGHGLTAWSLGGSFTGFSITWDGMGRATVSLPPMAPLSSRVLLHLSGVVATTVAGLLLLGGALAARRRFTLKMVLLVLAVNCLLEGPTYAFWNSVYPLPPGDLGRLWRATGPSGFRIPVVILSALISLGSTLIFSALFFQGIEEWFGGAADRTRPGKAGLLAGFLAVPGTAAWFVFDWNHLIPGIGRTPCVVGAATFWMCAALLWRWSLPPRLDPPPPTSLRAPIAVGWIVALGTLAAIVLRLSNGVSWG